MTAYYNEFDPYAAQWLRNLITAGHIAPGVVDERSIEDVTPADLTGFTQCHFFAGVGVWSLALRKAGWPDDLPVWTGSCPCQPFSAAGAGAGFADSRHLWPSFAWLIRQCRPAVVFGEQVASKAVEPWVDLVHADLEALGYAFGAVPFPSAGVGAPHIRDRLFWVADSEELRREGKHLRTIRGLQAVGTTDYSSASRLADSNSRECDGVSELRGHERHGQNAGRAQSIGEPEPRSVVLGVGYASKQSCERDAGSIFGTQAEINAQRLAVDGGLPIGSEHASSSVVQQRPAHPVNGFWRDADWISCRDGKWRPVEPGTFPLAHGATSRVGRLRAYGNAINAEAAHEFIAAYMA